MPPEGARGRCTAAGVEEAAVDPAVRPRARSGVHAPVPPSGLGGEGREGREGGGGGREEEERGRRRRQREREEAAGRGRGREAAWDGGRGVNIGRVGSWPATGFMGRIWAGFAVCPTTAHNKVLFFKNYLK